jgi:probable F420-dependent oxidoreductase
VAEPEVTTNDSLEEGMSVPTVGIQVFPGDGFIRPVDLARALEDRGFAALFFPEHLHMPVERTIEFPIPIPLPEIYKRNFDPFLSFAAISSVTTRLTFGTGISLVAQRDPILLAKTVATLDHLCEGRFVLGVGAGWNVEEMKNHGVDPGHRWSHVEDHVRAMRTIWTEDVATYHGRFIDFDRIWSWPKPYRKRHMPVLVGGSPSSFPRILRWADGWIPALDGDVDPLLAAIGQLRNLAAERRPGVELDITVAAGYGRDLSTDEFRQLSEARVTRILVAINPGSYRETVAALDKAASVARDSGWDGTGQ